MINPELYRALCAVFGQRNVTPIKQGMRGRFKFGTKKRIVDGKVEDYRTICKEDEHNSVVGEEFKVPCPFCRDHKQRLYINHLWGTRDRVTGSTYIWMANCYNQGCMSDFDNRKALMEMLKDRADLSAPLQQGKDSPRDIKADWPGDVWPFYDLAKREPTHPAVQFANARMWDIEKLSRMYDVRILIQPRYWAAAMTDRIVVPVYGGNKELKTWTARKVREELEGAKWLHCPYVGTGNTIYGLAAARRHRVPVIVEGPADAWNLRGRAAAIFGKVLQDGKAKRIARSCEDAVAIAVCLDPEQDMRAYYDGRPHHLDAAIETLRRHTEKPIIKVELPKGHDPGSLDYDITDYHIVRSADEQRIRI